MRTHAPEMIDLTAQDTFRRPRFNFDNFHAVFGSNVSLYYRFNSKPPITGRHCWPDGEHEKKLQTVKHAYKLSWAPQNQPLRQKCDRDSVIF